MKNDFKARSNPGLRLDQLALLSPMPFDWSSPVVRSLVLLGGFLFASYTSVCVLLRFYQTRFIFLPSAAIETTPDLFRLSYQDVWLPVKTATGTLERMHGWWIPAAGPEVGVLLYLHGNGINIGANTSQAHRFHQLGFSVLLIDYRGYGYSEGSFPTEATVYQDAATAWNYLTQIRKIPPQRIFYLRPFPGGGRSRSNWQAPSRSGWIDRPEFLHLN